MRASILQGELLDIGDSPAQSPDIPDVKIDPERYSGWFKATQEVGDRDRIRCF